MLSDAELMQQDMPCMLNFSSAFNIIYHYRLWQTMQMLGFGMTCINAWQSTYADCGPLAQLAGGEKKMQPDLPGHTQGDSLSPLLCIIAIEP